MMLQGKWGERDRERERGGSLTSGARNSGVPQNVAVRQPYHMSSLHSPKSAIFTNPSLSRRRLSSFKSLRGARNRRASVCAITKVTRTTQQVGVRVQIYIKA